MSGTLRRIARRCARALTEALRAHAARVALLAALGAAMCGGAAAQDARYSEDEVKAAFLYHFGTYVQWPPGPGDAGPITIAVLGAERVAAQLRAFLPGRTIQSRPVAVRSIGRIADLGDAQVLFIGSDRSADVAQLIAAVRKRPVLIVTDSADGLSRGAMVNFQLVDQRVRFEISVPRAQEAGLVLSSRLLSAALRVETSRSEPDPRGALRPAPVFTARAR